MRLIDVREYPEFASGHIEGSDLVPLGGLEKASAGWDRDQAYQIVCRTGRRAEQAKKLLQGRGFRDVSVLEGGLEAWKQAGKPLSLAPRQPWSMERQVRFGAGSLVLCSVVLGALASKKFFWGAGLVGVGLVYAGASDNCMLGRLLGQMPWNRPERANV